jgi:carbamoyl-phosphate synthase small subunit
VQGDPSAAPYAVENAKAILGKKPVFGICMGHQILGQAFGGKTFKLKFGHHVGNHPIRHNPSGGTAWPDMTWNSHHERSASGAATSHKLEVHVCMHNAQCTGRRAGLDCCSNARV